MDALSDVDGGAQLQASQMLRVAVLLAWYAVTNDDEYLNEAWLIQHDFDPRDFPMDTVCFVSTKELLEMLRDHSSRAQRTALVLCTLQALLADN